MFSKSSNSRNGGSPVAATGARNTPFSIIGGDVVITGNVEASVDLHIDGKVDGDISCAALVQGAESRIKGHVTARTARIGGLVEGSISAEELIVEATARITGDVSYDVISIATGGQIDGKMSHMSGPRATDLKLVKTDAS
jgi:cytoskeletal protein CcmA (bactofilin family)